MRPMARRRRRAMIIAAMVVAAGGATVPAGAAQATPACDVVYTTNDWGSGFTANIALTNLGDPIQDWTLRFAFAGNQTITHGWSATWSQDGSDVTATNESWNGDLGTGDAAHIGFNATYSGTNAEPTSFSVNGMSCGGVPQPPTVTLDVPAGPFEAPADVPLTAAASDPDGTISKVDFYRNGLLVGTDTTAPYAYTLQALPAGTYTVQAKAYDDTGRSAVAEKSFTVEPPSGPRLVATPAAVGVPEGASATVTLTLSEAPAASVPVSLTRTGDTDITVAPTSLTLTTGNWNTGVTVTVSAAEDADTAGAPRRSPRPLPASPHWRSPRRRWTTTTRAATTSTSRDSSPSTARSKIRGTSAPRACRTTPSRP